MKQTDWKKYFPSEIEKKWQDVWREAGLYKFNEPSSKSKKFYTLVELPYPSGDLHIGHWFTFIAPDVLSRFKRMQGYDVFFPMGYDAFGLPAENAAIKRQVHPKDWTEKNIETMTKQFETMGTMIDWDHVTITCKPEYFRWNQWIFIKMFEKGIAYRGKTLSNWCPTDQTVLANEHVENGKCWRCGSIVVQKEVEQWFLKITDYAEQLLWPEQKGESVKRKEESKENDENKTVYPSPLPVSASTVDWPKSVMVAQNEWIGKKEGLEITFQVVSKDGSPVMISEASRRPEQSEGSYSKKKDSSPSVQNDKKEATITVFTTTPINFGATFIVLAPEHKIIPQITTPEQKEAVGKYIQEASEKTELDRMSEGREKTGVFTGSYVINHVTGEKIPVWVADYALINFGTGAVQGCPGHDQKDFEFAKKYGIPTPRVVVGPNGETGPITERADQVKAGVKAGVMMNSGFLDGIEFTKAMEKTKDYFEEKGWGKRVVTYHLHDWSVSRQRYWGTPVPMIHCDTDGIIPVPLEDLPVTLPYDVDYQPKGKAPLASNEEWLKVKCPKCGKDAKRDPETLDTFFDSSWYYYRYVDPHYDKAPFETSKVEKLMPVDIYFGGGEHTLGHTLYARFFTKFFKDLGMVDFDEFALKRIQHGIVLGPDGNKMSKSKGNVINPDDVVKEYGTDAVRVYLSFMMPYNATGPWSVSAMYGMFRFLKRIWDLYPRVVDAQPSRDDLSAMHTAIKKVTEDIQEAKNNTAIAAIMKWLNYLEGKAASGKGKVTLAEFKNLLIVLSPFAPHITEELWQLNKLSDNEAKDVGFRSIHQESWPKHDDSLIVSDTVIIAVQINGKLRETLSVESSLVDDKAKVEELAKQSEKVQTHLSGKPVKKMIYVRGKILNFVV